METLSSTGFALFGAALVALGYGLARFGYGLFVLPIRAELKLMPYAIGIMGAMPMASFLFATLVAPVVALGERNGHEVRCASLVDSRRVTLDPRFTNCLPCPTKSVCLFIVSPRP